MFRHSVREFAEMGVMPRSRKIGKEEKILTDLWRKICDLGIMGIS